MYDALHRSGYCPRTTPVDTLMAAPYGVALGVADAMQGDDLPTKDDLDGFSVHEEWEYA